MSRERERAGYVRLPDGEAPGGDARGGAVSPQPGPAAPPPPPPLPPGGAAPPAGPALGPGVTAAGAAAARFRRVSPGPLERAAPARGAALRKRPAALAPAPGQVGQGARAAGQRC
jgi:hypothetical protein